MNIATFMNICSIQECLLWELVVLCLMNTDCFLICKFISPSVGVEIYAQGEGS